MRIFYTEDRGKMIDVGKEICAEKREIYTESFLSSMRQYIHNFYSNNYIDDVLYASIYDYWAYGNTLEEEIGYDFIHKGHKEKKAYITLREKLNYISILNDSQYRSILDNKYKAYKYFEEFYHREIAELTSENDYDSFISFIKRHPFVVIKPASLSDGTGIYVKDYSNASESEKKKSFYEILERGASEVQDHKVNTEGIVIEEFIEQADEMKLLHPSSINIVRIYSLNTDSNGIILKWPYLGIAMNGESINNCSRGAMRARIDISNGLVTTDGMTNLQVKYEVHPNSKIRIKGFQIPQWTQMCNIVINMAKRIPQVRFIGWDMAYSTVGWSVVEANYSPGIFGAQLYNGGVKEEFEKLFTYHMDKEFWWK